ncbi:hypothetical protein DNTS_020560, partial [Danionella cerebrum]
MIPGKVEGWQDEAGEQGLLLNILDWLAGGWLAAGAPKAPYLQAPVPVNCPEKCTRVREEQEEEEPDQEWIVERNTSFIYFPPPVHPVNGKLSCSVKPKT